MAGAMGVMRRSACNRSIVPLHLHEAEAEYLKARALQCAFGPIWGRRPSIERVAVDRFVSAHATDSKIH